MDSDTELPTAADDHDLAAELDYHRARYDDLRAAVQSLHDDLVATLPAYVRIHDLDLATRGLAAILDQHPA